MYYLSRTFACCNVSVESQPYNRNIYNTLLHPSWNDRNARFYLFAIEFCRIVQQIDVILFFLVMLILLSNHFMSCYKYEFVYYLGVSGPRRAGGGATRGCPRKPGEGRGETSMDTIHCALMCVRSLTTFL